MRLSNEGRVLAALASAVEPLLTSEPTRSVELALVELVTIWLSAFPAETRSRRLDAFRVQAAKALQAADIRVAKPPSRSGWWRRHHRQSAKP